MNDIDEKIKEIVANKDNYISYPDGFDPCALHQLIRNVRWAEAGLLAEKVLKLLPKGSPIELDIGTTLEGHLMMRRIEARDNTNLMKED